MIDDPDHIYAWPSLTLPEGAWEPTDKDGEDPTGRLTASFYLNGQPMQLVAMAVKMVKGLQEGDNEFPEDLGYVFSISGQDGPFMTTNIGGREYVLVAYPF